MTFASGRTQEQSARTCVVEGSRIYVSPAVFERIRVAGANPDLSHVPDIAAEQRTIRMLRAAGLSDGDMRLLRFVPRLDVVVDREMVD